MAALSGVNWDPPDIHSLSSASSEDAEEGKHQTSKHISWNSAYFSVARTRTRAHAHAHTHTHTEKKNTETENRELLMKVMLHKIFLCLSLSVRLHLGQILLPEKSTFIMIIR